MKEDIQKLIDAIDNLKKIHDLIICAKIELLLIQLEYQLKSIRGDHECK